MRRRSAIPWVLLLTTTTLAAGCRTAPIPAIEHQILTTDADPTLEEAEQRIRAGASARGWTISDEGSGHLVGRLRARNHLLVVDILHDRSSFDVRYRSSENLMDNGGGSAHRKVGAWMTLLARAISEEP